MWRHYVLARSLDEAAQVLANEGSRARVVAGATDLMIELERKVRTGIDTLIDVSRIPGTDQITLELPSVSGTPDIIHCGPLVTHAQACASPLIQARALPLAQACWEVGAPQIRNRATLAGNLITASPANDTITPLMALEGVLTLRSLKRGDRRVKLSDFYTGVRRTVMQPDELLVDIAIPAMGEDERGMFIKLGLRRAQAISIVNVAAVVARRGAQLTRARIALGCVAPVIVRCDEAERYLVGKTLTDDCLAQAGLLAQQAAKPIDDIRAPASYRRDMVAVVVKRALSGIASGQNRGQLPDKPVRLASGQTQLLNAAKPPTQAHGLNDPAPGESKPNQITSVINGHQRTLTLLPGPDKTLLRALREDAGLIGTKEGCAEGECGACTVFLDGQAVMSCLVPAERAQGAAVETIEALAASAVSATLAGGTQDSSNTLGDLGPARSQLHPLQQAFIDEAAVQCGYCTPGFLMVGAKLLEERPDATQAEVQEAISGNLCRCTGYYKILAAFETAKRIGRERQGADQGQGMQAMRGQEI